MGINLVLVARRKNKLEELATTLKGKYDVIVKTIVLDLLEEKAVETLISETDGL